MGNIPAHTYADCIHALIKNYTLNTNMWGSLRLAPIKHSLGGGATLMPKSVNLFGSVL